MSQQIEKSITVLISNIEDALQLEQLGKFYALKAIEHSMQNHDADNLINVDYPFGPFKLTAHCIKDFQVTYLDVPNQALLQTYSVSSEPKQLDEIAKHVPVYIFKIKYIEVLG